MTDGCERPSCRPTGYERLCAKHYLALVDSLWGFGKKNAQELANASNPLSALTNPEEG